MTSKPLRKTKEVKKIILDFLSEPKTVNEIHKLLIAEYDYNVQTKYYLQLLINENKIQKIDFNIYKKNINYKNL